MSRIFWLLQTASSRFLGLPGPLLTLAGVAVLFSNSEARKHKAKYATERYGAEKSMSVEYEFEKRLLALETKAKVRRMWTDMEKRAIPGILFMAGAVFLFLATHDKMMMAAAAFFYFGAALYTFI